MKVAAESKPAAWASLIGPLGLAGTAVDERVAMPAGAPPLAGTIAWAGLAPVLAGKVERVGQNRNQREVTLILNRPGARPRAH
ncbi:MAG: hypothetical protein ACRCVA_19740 [Phreatobacter sp.]